ncbi:lipoyl(octanoyl) transferase LipB [Permianibacter sp. IMCC34836]|uniref:lipoyl(octanoyl) transferase LipB n=1 Tax=Permianibacter fluminis TaxID=2738515 RepID=UPI00155639FB|nr:lipoyl(octanoyl) transferase LipB [Permianibacter fluminis]NQD36639.1 lipoyl(octanoyl) transferase LipB [Permianibacter fluminis]
MSLTETVILRQLGRQTYKPIWQAMKTLTDARDETSHDEIWLVEHERVFTQGQAGKAEHVLAPGDIPVVQVDRGGQVTYHGPGQQVVYFLLDLRRKKLGVRELVTALENAVVDTCAHYGIAVAARADAPGVYLTAGKNTGAKICSIGLRVRHGCTFHGIAFNIAMDLEPFFRINPCGYQGLQMTTLANEGGPASLSAVEPVLIKALLSRLGYNAARSAPADVALGQPLSAVVS